MLRAQNCLRYVKRNLPGIGTQEDLSVYWEANCFTRSMTWFDSMNKSDRMFVFRQSSSPNEVHDFLWQMSMPHADRLISADWKMFIYPNDRFRECRLLVEMCYEMLQYLFTNFSLNPTMEHVVLNKSHICQSDAVPVTKTQLFVIIHSNFHCLWSPVFWWSQKFELSSPKCKHLQVYKSAHMQIQVQNKSSASLVGLCQGECEYFR